MRYACLIIFSFTLTFVGCGDQDAGTGDGPTSDGPNPANFDKVDVGMSVEQVEGLIGPAKTTVEEITGEMRLWDKPNGDGFGVTFEDGKVTSTSTAPATK